MPRSTLVLLAAVAVLATACTDDAPPSAGSPAPEALEFRNPLFDVEVGEWALYRLLKGNEMYLEVKAVAPANRVVTLQSQTREAETGRLLSSSAPNISPNNFLFGFASSGAIVTRLSTETVRVAGRSWDCLCVETISPKVGPVKHYFSDEAPVTGLILQKKMGVEKDNENARLIDWSGREQGD